MRIIFYIACIFSGRLTWLNIRRKTKFDDDKDALFIIDDSLVDYYSDIKEWLPLFCSRKHFKKIIIVSTNEFVFSSDITETNCFILEEKQYYNLVKYYSVIQFANYIYPLIWKDSFGNLNMIGYKGLTFSDYLRGLG